MIYFDNAATGGAKPKSVVAAVNYALKGLCANPGRSGHSLSQKAAEEIFACRQAVSDFFGSGKPENVAFVSNCTHALNCVIKGAPLLVGDHIITSSLEHNAVMRPLESMRTSGKIKYDIANVFDDDLQTVNEFSRLITPKTRMIICTHASNVTGKVLPIKQIGRLCKKNNILFAVDAAQSSGVIDIDMQDMCIDYLCVAPHKSLFAPMGIGILIANAPISHTIIEGGTGTNSLELTQPDFMPDRVESGTVNLPAICGIKAGIEHINRVGKHKIYRHEIRLLQRLYSGLKSNKNVVLYTSYPKENEYAPVLSFNFAGEDSNSVAEFLNKHGIAVRAGLHCAPLAHKTLKTLNSGTVRVSLGAFNTMGEVEQFLRVLNLKEKH